MIPIPYEELDKHFTAPRHLNKEPMFTYSRFPRKKKKQLKQVKHCNGDLNAAMWNTMEDNYRRFIIKQLCTEK